ncbi:MAG: hypothetical protein JO348_00615 [Alphaproteobacteria bacterium]|nr:hypothetical protein [Alphaproteobacteria bacterium]
MLKAFLHRYIRGFENRYGYDASYMHEMTDISEAAFNRFAIMQMAGGQWQSSAPRDAWHAAGIASALVEDCGPCVQIASDMAIEAGMPVATIAALLAGAPTDANAQLGFDYGRALLHGSENLDELRDQIAAKWGQPALLAISLHAMTARNFPVIKRALGHAKTCQRVRVGKDDVVVNQMLKAA